MTTPGPFHNPDNLTDAQIGTAEGWRLLRVGEVIESGDEAREYQESPWVAAAGAVGCPVCDIHWTMRTRRPDPLKAEPRPVESKWVRFSDAMPTGPFYCWRSLWNDGETRDISCYLWKAGEGKSAIEMGWTHWHPAPPLPEPPREGTQREKDERRLIEWWRGLSIDFAHDHLASDDAVNAWHAALAWERAEVAEMLPAKMPARDTVTVACMCDAIDAIRARVASNTQAES